MAARAAILEARLGMLPRPINEQHLSSYAAWRRLVRVVSKSFGLFLIAITASALVIYSLMLIYELGARLRWWQQLPALTEDLYLWLALLLLAVGACLSPFLALVADLPRLWYGFFGMAQRETHGTARWGTRSELAEKGLLFRFDPSEVKPLADLQNKTKARNDKIRALFSGAFWRLADKLFFGDVPANPLQKGYLPFAPFGFGRWICFPLETVARHICFLGPPGSGKSASFFILQARCFASLGSAVILDLKGEIYAYAARYYRKVYRFDLQRPECSDRFLLGRMCRRDVLAAGELADLITGYDPNRQSTENPFWKQSSSMLLKCLLLHLAEENPDFTPADVFKFLAEHQFNEQDQKDRLAETLMNSPNRDAAEGFAPFSNLDARTKSNVVVSMAAELKAFHDPVVRKILSPPSEEEKRRGCQVIDPALLRRKGTALFVVVPEGRASQLSNVLGTVFGSIANILRRTGDADDFRAFLKTHALRMIDEQRRDRIAQNLRQKHPRKLASEIDALLREECAAIYISENELGLSIENPAFTLLQFDEAGNVPLRNLSEDVGVGRGRRMPYVLGYQNLDQPEKQYGQAYANSLIQSVGTKTALPGLNDKTAEYFTRLLGKTTTLQRSSDDARDDRFDTEKISETGRELMSASEVRTLPAYTQAVFISTDQNPLRVGFPPDAKQIDSVKLSPPIYSDALALSVEETLKNETSGEIVVQTAPSKTRAVQSVKRDIALWNKRYTIRTAAASTSATASPAKADVAETGEKPIESNSDVKSPDFGEINLLAE